MQENTVYIIDDNKAVCESLTFLFDSHDINVRTFHSPLLFLKEFSKDWRGCLIIDLFMPSMNGLDLVKEIKIRTNQIPIVVISGHGGYDAGLKAIQAGAFAFLEKPFKINKLLDLINQLF